MKLANGSPLVSKYELNPEFVSARRVHYDDFIVLWMLASNTIIPLTQLMQLWDSKHGGFVSQFSFAFSNFAQ